MSDVKSNKYNDMRHFQECSTLPVPPRFIHVLDLPFLHFLCKLNSWLSESCGPGDSGNSKNKWEEFDLKKTELENQERKEL